MKLTVDILMCTFWWAVGLLYGLLLVAALLMGAIVLFFANILSELDDFRSKFLLP